MNTLINLIEDAYYSIKRNKEIIIAGTVVATIGGLVLGLIMVPFFM